MMHTNCNCGTVHEQVLVLRTCQHIAMSKTSNNVQWDALPDGVPMAAGNQLACHLPGRSTYYVSDALEQMSCISSLHQAPTPACPTVVHWYPLASLHLAMVGRERERERGIDKVEANHFFRRSLLLDSCDSSSGSVYMLSVA